MVPSACYTVEICARTRKQQCSRTHWCTRVNSVLRTIRHPPSLGTPMFAADHHLRHFQSLCACTIDLDRAPTNSVRIRDPFIFYVHQRLDRPGGPTFGHLQSARACAASILGPNSGHFQRACVLNIEAVYSRELSSESLFLGRPWNPSQPACALWDLETALQDGQDLV